MGSDSSDKKRRRPSFAVIWITCCVLYFGGDVLWSHFHTEDISYSEAIKMVEDGRVSEAIIKGDSVTLIPDKLLDVNNEIGGKKWESKILTGSDRLEDALASAEVDYEAKPSGWFDRNWGWFVVLGILLLIIGILAEKETKGAGSGIFSFTKHKGRRAENVDTTYEDVAGYPGVKGDLQEVVAFLKNPEGFSRLGASCPTGVLLHGPPGTGKTLLARATAGEAGVPFIHISGSDFVDMFNEAALLATREGAESIVTDHLIRAIELVVIGHPDTARRLSDKDRQAVAVHEAGHAYALAAMGGRKRVVRVSIIPNSTGALGYNLVSPEDEAEAQLREAPELLAQIIVLLAGRAAEREMIGQVSTGASDDLRRANKIAYDYVTHYGFDTSLKNRVLYANETRWSQDTARKVDEAIEKILTDCYKQAIAIIEANKGLIGRFVTELLEEEEVSGGSLQDNLRSVQPLTRLAQALSA